MELVGAISAGEWSSLSGIYSLEEAEIMTHLLPNYCGVSNELNGAMSLEALHCSSGMADSYSYYNFSQGSSNHVFPVSTNENYNNFYSHPTWATKVGSTAFCAEDVQNNTNAGLFLADEGNECLNKEMISNGDGVVSELKWEPEMMTVPELAMENVSLHGNSKKRSRGSADHNRRNAKTRKSSEKLTLTSDNEEDGNTKGQSSSSCSSEDYSNAFPQELGGVASTSSLSPKEATALNLNGKTRATRGSATDPQSVYARKRREKINERLRILQNLVPNGTKVDISTMLEEAVQYVKFLQVQIKLLSSDDLWMYAPLAYNGMHSIGLDLGLASVGQ
ncbi:hypothetical protein UlMin_031115 [Ulmus minor]